jgi:hypothetical protein
MGYKWKAGDGSRIRLWEDLWFGTCSLAIQYWRLYCIVNEQGVTIKKAWDGVNLKFTFRRMVNRELMDQWLELVQITGSIHLSNDEDAIIWQYESKGRYSVQSLYAVVNNRGGGTTGVHTFSVKNPGAPLGYTSSYGCWQMGKS